MKNNNRTSFTQNKLLGASDSYKNGFQVSMLQNQRNIRTTFDCKREIIFEDNKTFFDTKPFDYPQQATVDKIISNGLKDTSYSQ
jgi:hypothetical protein